MAAQLPSIPYKGDDAPQTMARVMWLPMLAMGLMAVAIGFVASVSAGVEIGDFFGGEGAEALRTGRSTGAWAVATVFLGMAFILSSITMVLVNILRTMRDSGRDVQQSLRAREILQLEKPWTGHLIPPVMMMGMMTVVVAFGLGVWQATLISDVPAAGIADASVLEGEALADLGTAEAVGQWLGPLNLLGLALIFVSIVLALRTIVKAITFQAQRLQQLAREAGSPAPASPGPAPTTPAPAPGAQPGAGWRSQPYVDR